MSRDGKFAVMAAEAAERLDQARAAGKQLSFLADPDDQGGQLVEQKRGPGRPKGAKGKTETKLREMLAARGLRMPADVLAEIAGLTSRDDVMTATMADVERLLLYVGGDATPAMRLGLFVDLYKVRLRAIEGMMPYVHAKVTPDGPTLVQSTTIMLPPAPERPAGQVIEHQQRGAWAPPPLPQEIEGKQGLSDGGSGQSDGGELDGGASD